MIKRMYLNLMKSGIYTLNDIDNMDVIWFFDLCDAQEKKDKTVRYDKNGQKERRAFIDELTWF